MRYIHLFLYIIWYIHIYRKYIKLFCFRKIFFWLNHLELRSCLSSKVRNHAKERWNCICLLAVAAAHQLPAACGMEFSLFDFCVQKNEQETAVWSGSWYFPNAASNPNTALLLLITLFAISWSPFWLMCLHGNYLLLGIMSRVFQSIPLTANFVVFESD